MSIRQVLALTTAVGASAVLVLVVSSPTGSARAAHPAAARSVSPASGVPLPLRYSTGRATRVLTVTAPSSTSTTATVQAWVKVSGGGWAKYGSSAIAHVGAQGIGQASETRSVTPAGSWTLTQGFGAYPDPGSPLPYFQTNAADWWISQAGPLYNTHQRCSGSCPFTQGSPNEHLYYERPYYNYAVVIDYNTRNAPGGVRPGAGSAFFLHVTDGQATAGCVAMPQTNVINTLKWLAPSTHPRILIGVV